MTRRFDRTTAGGKIHVQTLCAMDHLDFRQIGVHDYAQLFLVVDRPLGLGPETRAGVFRRMTFNVAAAICDDHPKNFSFLLPEGGDWRLSPAYDVTHAHAPSSKWTREHLMAVNGRRLGITRADILEVGDRFVVPAATDIVEEVLESVAKWRTFAAEARVPNATAEQIGTDIDSWSGPLSA
jgi:serine/threonine-protein kinase HipA